MYEVIDRSNAILLDDMIDLEDILIVVKMIGDNTTHNINVSDYIQIIESLSSDEEVDELIYYKAINEVTLASNIEINYDYFDMQFDREELIDSNHYEQQDEDIEYMKECVIRKYIEDHPVAITANDYFIEQFIKRETN